MRNGNWRYDTDYSIKLVIFIVKLYVIYIRRLNSMIRNKDRQYMFKNL